MAPFTEEQIEFLESMFRNLSINIDIRGWNSTTKHINVELHYTDHERDVSFQIDSSTDDMEVGELNKVDYHY